MVKEHNSEMRESKIREMSHEELIEAVIRMFSVEAVNSEEWRGAVYLPDQLADAFRGKNQ